MLGKQHQLMLFSIVGFIACLINFHSVHVFPTVGHSASFFASVLRRHQFDPFVYSCSCLNALTLLTFLSYPAPHSQPLIMPLHTSLKMLALFEFLAKT